MLIRSGDITASYNDLLVSFQCLPLYSRCHFLKAAAQPGPGSLCRRTGARTRRTCSRCRCGDSHAPSRRCWLNEKATESRWNGRRAPAVASAATGGGDGGRSHHFLRQLRTATLAAIITTFHHSAMKNSASVPKWKRRSDQTASGAALRLRAPSFCARTADALPSTELLLCSIVLKYVAPPPRPLLSFPSSCSRLFDNGGKWVLKRQLAAAQPCSLRRGAASWLTLMASLGYRLLGSSPR